MKPISLEIAGLNSFRAKQTIDFDPLLADGLFGIFGPTGSGKSSILDAMTLALYGKVKRAHNGKGGIINIREKSCSVRFAFEIECDGVRRRYSIERVFARATGRSEGVQTRRARLVEHCDSGDRVIAEKQAEIDACVYELLGIEYQEFMRAVVLPQGSFADFLALAPRDRAGVLQRLFGLQELGNRLNSRLRAQAEQMRTARANLEGRLAELRAFDDDAVAAANDRLAEAQTLEASARESERRASEHLRDVEGLRKLLDERRELEARDAERPRVESELGALRLRIERSQRASSIATAVDALRRAEARHAHVERELFDAVSMREVASRRLAEASERRERAVHSHDARYDTLCSELARLETARDTIATVERKRRDAETSARVVSEHAAEVAAITTARDTLREEVARSETAIAELSQRLGSIEVSASEQDRVSQLSVKATNLRGLQLRHSEKRSAMSRLEAEIATLTSSLEDVQREERLACDALLASRSELHLKKGVVEELARERETIGDRYRHLSAQLEIIESLETQCREYEQSCAAYRSRVDEQDTQWQVLEHRFTGASERHKQLQVEREEIAEQLQAAYRRHAIATLAPQLRDGEPCALCGSQHHPSPARSGENGHDDLAVLEARAQQLDHLIAQAREVVGSCAERMKVVSTTKENALESLESQRRAMAVARTKIGSALVAAGGNMQLASAEDVRMYLAEITARGAEARAQLELARERVAALEESERELQDRVNASGGRRAVIAAELGSMQSQHLDASNEASVLASECESVANEIAAESGGMSIDEIDEHLKRIRDSVRTVEHLREGIANETRKLALTRLELERVAADLSRCEREHTTAASMLAVLEAEIAQQSAALSAQISALTDDHHSDVVDASLVLRLIDERTRLRDDLALERSTAESAFNEAASHERVAIAAVELHSLTLRREAEERDRLSSDCDAALVAQGFATIDEASDALIDPVVKATLDDEVRTIEETLRSISDRLREVVDRIGGRTQSPEDYDRAVAAADHARSELESAIGRAASARDEVARVSQRNSEYRAYTAENADVLERERTAEQLARYLQGDAFINFLADERLSEVCMRASRMLEDLSGGRYEIFSRSDEGFMIRDMGNGGVERSPSSLSGGESFVVSLSLALALSDTIQMGRSPLEFFFLDEGFGTLDAELLDTVVDTLEKLRTRRRTIGLITHVGMLRERVSRRLIVAPPSDAAGSLVRYEVA